MEKLLACLCRLLCLSVPVTMFGVLNGDGDYQFWWWNVARVKMGGRWDFLMTTEMRWGDNVSKMFYTYLQPQFAYAFTDWVSVEPGYRQATKRFPNDSSKWVLESSPMLDLLFTMRPAGWEILDRNRLEYNISKDTNYPWLYRNRLRFYTPFHWTAIKMTPFFEEELFWRQADGINEVRVSVGLQETYTGHFGTEVYYMAHFNKTATGWVHQNVFNLALEFKY